MLVQARHRLVNKCTKGSGHRHSTTLTGKITGTLGPTNQPTTAHTFGMVRGEPHTAPFNLNGRNQKRPLYLAFPFQIWIGMAGTPVTVWCCRPTIYRTLKAYRIGLKPPTISRAPTNIKEQTPIIFIPRSKNGPSLSTE